MCVCVLFVFFCPKGYIGNGGKKDPFKSIHKNGPKRVLATPDHLHSRTAALQYDSTKTCSLEWEKPGTSPKTKVLGSLRVPIHFQATNVEAVKLAPHISS